MKILVTGSRDLNNETLITDFIETTMRQLSRYNIKGYTYLV